MSETMVTCPNCTHGFRGEEEIIIEGCYTCGASGEITESHYFDIRLQGTCDIIARNVVEELKKLANSREDCEGWNFQAAEQGMSVYQYENMVVTQEAEKVSQIFKKFADEGNLIFVKAIVDRICPFNGVLAIKPRNKKKVVKLSPEEADNKKVPF